MLVGVSRLRLRANEANHRRSIIAVAVLTAGCSDEEPPPILGHDLDEARSWVECLNAKEREIAQTIAETEGIVVEKGDTPIEEVLRIRI